MIFKKKKNNQRKRKEEGVNGVFERNRGRVVGKKIFDDEGNLPNCKNERSPKSVFGDIFFRENRMNKPAGKKAKRKVR